MDLIESLFGRPKCLLGVIHLLPLPGSPRWTGSMGGVADRALADAEALEASGFDGIVIENFGDAPFSRGFAGAGAVAGLAAVGARVADATRLPLGVNVLRNDAESAVSVAAAIGARFIRVNVHVGAAATDQGIVQGDARSTMRAIRDQSPGLAVFADVLVKHARPLGETDPGRVAADTAQRGLAHALIVTGEATGAPAPLDRVVAVRTAVPTVPVLVGSGVTPATARAVLEACDGIIVGSALMAGGKAGGPIDRERAALLAREARPRRD